jgi:hypothetical protein
LENCIQYIMVNLTSNEIHVNNFAKLIKSGGKLVKDYGKSAVFTDFPSLLGSSEITIISPWKKILDIS